jgi:integrase
MKGDGSIYPRGKGGVLWISYSRDGQRWEESAGTTSRDVAEKKLRALRRRVERGEALRASERRVTVKDLLDDLLTHLGVREVPYAAKAKYHVKPLLRDLGDIRAVGLETSMVERYQEGRKADGLAAATINRECELLRQAFRLAARRVPPKVRSIPYVPMLRVRNARQGFLGRADAEALLAAIDDDDIRDFVEWFWRTGMRPKEIRRLTWDMYDREAKALTVSGAITKTGKPRTIPVTGERAAIIERRLERRRLDCPLIFQRRGKPIIQFRTTWRAALEVAHLPAGLRPYDLRRTAVRNMIRARVHERVAMEISGHLTRSTFDRYNIVSPDDVAAALDQTESFVKSQPAERNVAPLRPAAAQGKPARKRTTADVAESSAVTRSADDVRIARNARR